MMKNSLSVALINRRGQATIMSKMRKNSIDNICPPTSLLAGKKRGFFSPDREKVGGEKEGVRRLWECGKRSKGVVNSESFPCPCDERFPSFPQLERGGKGGGDFLFKPL